MPHPPTPGAPATAPARTSGTPAALLDWLRRDALPAWAARGIDLDAGGFHERLDSAGRPVDAPRRTRVVARQVYVFATAVRQGWMAQADTLVEHGLRFLLERLRQPDGTYAASVRPDGRVVDPRFDLYEQAFALFALAAARAGRPDREPLRREAEALLAVLRRGWAHPMLGFEEGAPRTLPLKSNPHMHLLEAALAWLELSEGADRSPWAALADELVTLCTTRLVAPATGAVHEYFDGDWRPAAGAAGAVVEPGHQFEWAWLLMRWGRLAPSSSEAQGVARRLLDVGEHHGVDTRRGVAVNALGDGLAVVDAGAKVWPQTERIKAWCAAARDGSEVQRAEAATRVRSAVAGLQAFLVDQPPGLWREEMDASGSCAEGECRASSLYHIVCAAEVLADAGLGDGPG